MLGIEWQVAKVGFAPGEQPDGTFVVPAQPGAGVVKTPAPVQAAATQPPVSSNGNGNKRSNGRADGNGNGHVTITEPPMPWALFLLGQTKALIDVYAMACEYASQKHGNTVRNEDVRSLMLSAFINVSKNGGANVA